MSVAPPQETVAYVDRRLASEILREARVERARVAAEARERDRRSRRQGLR